MVFKQHLPGRAAAAKPRRLDSYPLQIWSWKDPSVRRITGATDKTRDGWILLAASVSGSRCCASRDLQWRLRRTKPLLVLRVKAVLFQIRRGYVKDLLEAIFFFFFFLFPTRIHHRSEVLLMLQPTNWTECWFWTMLQKPWLSSGLYEMLVPFLKVIYSLSI